MSKQTSRQASKQGQNSNKQSNNQSSKQTSPANKQIASGSVKQSNSVNKPQTRQAIKQERRQEERQRRLDAQRRAARNKRILWISLIVAAVIVVATVSAVVFANTHKPTGQNQTSQTPTSFPTEQVFNPAYQPVDGIYCDQLEKTFYHIHAHLTIYINGKQVTVPQGVGIASDQSCFYWLHTHTSDGVVHIEFPRNGSPTLGNFLDIWEQKFPQLGYHDELASTADWTVYVDGRQVNSNFNQLVLQPHMVITIAYNSPNIKPDTSFNWPPNE